MTALPARSLSDVEAVNLRLYGVLDPALIASDDPIDAARAAVAGGVTAIQYRNKVGSTRLQVDHVGALRAALPAHIPVIVNDRVDVAAAAGADGVHLGQNDLHPRDARAILGPAAIIGITVHHAVEATLDGAPDYAGLGPVFTTSSKDPGDPPLGVGGLKILVQDVRSRLGAVPLVGIAGINAGNAAEVIALGGVDGVAVIGAVFGTDDPHAAAHALKQAVDRAMSKDKKP